MLRLLSSHFPVAHELSEIHRKTIPFTVSQINRLALYRYPMCFVAGDTNVRVSFELPLNFKNLKNLVVPRPEVSDGRVFSDSIDHEHRFTLFVDNDFVLNLQINLDFGHYKLIRVYITLREDKAKYKFQLIFSTYPIRKLPDLTYFF